MKPTYCLLLFMALAVPSHGQVFVNNVNINALPNVKYIQLVAQDRGKNTLILIDYGQPGEWSNDEKGAVSGADKKPVEFKSDIDALNFLCNNGWEYVDSKAVMASTVTLHYYTLKKKEDK